MSSELLISVIIPFYNAETHIKKCLDVLHKQDFKKSFEQRSLKFIILSFVLLIKTSRLVSDLK